MALTLNNLQSWYAIKQINQITYVRVEFIGEMKASNSNLVSLKNVIHKLIIYKYEIRWNG